MRLVATEYLSLDGVFEEPGRWSGPFFNDEAGEFKLAELRASDAQLLGRRTYEAFAAAWPSMTDEAGFAEKMNSMPKYIVTSTLDTLDWPGSKPVRGELADEVRGLKEQRGADLLLAGSGQLFRALMRHDLIDVYRFMVHPIVLGEGARLFPEGAGGVGGAGAVDGSGGRPLRLTGTQTFTSGVVVLEYVPDGS